LLPAGHEQLTDDPAGGEHARIREPVERVGVQGEKTRPNPAPVTSIPSKVEERLSPSSSDAQRIIPTVAAAKLSAAGLFAPGETPKASRKSRGHRLNMSLPEQGGGLRAATPQKPLDP
jgi:hypothetical protein